VKPLTEICEEIGIAIPRSAQVPIPLIAFNHQFAISGFIKADSNQNNNNNRYSSASNFFQLEQAKQQVSKQSKATRNPILKIELSIVGAHFSKAEMFILTPIFSVLRSEKATRMC